MVEANLEPLNLVKFPMSKHAWLMSRMSDGKPVPGHPGKQIAFVISFNKLGFCGVQFRDATGGTMDSQSNGQERNSGDQKPDTEEGKKTGCSGNCSKGNCESRGTVQQNVRETFARGQNDLP